MRIYNRKLGRWTTDIQGTAIFTGAELNAFLKWAESEGFHVYANKQFGGVNYSAHSVNSFHYMEDADGYSLAADIGTPGDVNERQRILNELIPVLNKYGIAYVYAQHGHVDNHWDHIHVDVGNIIVRGGTNSRVYTTKKRSPLELAGGKKREPRSILVSRQHTNNALTKIVQRITNVKVDEVFGPDTEAAVKQLQKRYGLKVDGVFGPNTAKANLQRHGTLARGDEKNQVRLVQYIAGIYRDGIYGKNTENAVKELQRWAGLKDDGVFGPNSREKLIT